jgi:hypothetical protein
MKPFSFDEWIQFACGRQAVPHPRPTAGDGCSGPAVGPIEYHLDGHHLAICGDSFNVLPRLPENSVDLCPTSPPYANQRKKHYKSVSEEDYPKWMVEFCDLVTRILKPHGSIVLVIAPHMKDGAVSPYVLKTQLALLDAGWHQVQRLYWHKPDAVPTGRRDRCRQSVEPILWLSKHPQSVYSDPLANGHPSHNMAGLTGGVNGNGKGYNNGVAAPGSWRTSRPGRLGAS